MLKEEKLRKKADKIIKISGDIAENEFQKAKKLMIKADLIEEARKLRDKRKPVEANKEDRVNLIPKEGFFKKLFKKKIKEKKALLINMELVSGFVEHFLIEIKDESFTFNKGTYIVDLSQSAWDLTAKVYALDYHEGFCLPIKRHVDIGKLNTAIINSKEYDCETATNPSNIRQFMLSNIIEQVIAGARLSKWLQAMRLMVIVILIIVSVSLLILFFKMGGVKLA